MKRHGEDMALVLTEKRPRNELVSLEGDNSKQVASIKRTSNLAAPIMLLTGHESEISSCKFHPNGETLVSAGFDRNILLWNTYDECKSYALLNGGHKGAILDVQFSAQGDLIFSASTDKNVIIWDAGTCVRVKKLTGHQGIVNSCSTSRDANKALLCSASDDKTVRIWDTRKRGVVSTFKDDYQLTAVTFNDAADQVIVGGIENVLKVYDMRKNKLLYTMAGHFDTITGLALSPDGNLVLSNSMDNSLCIWDIRPFVQTNRNLKTLTGHQHNFEKNLLRCSWSPDSRRVTAGSADRFVNIWDVYNKRILYKLPGHTGSVNEVVFHPKEPIVLSCSSDRQLYMGEIEA